MKPCPTCGQEYVSNSIKVHMKNCLGNVEVFNCEYCSYATNSRRKKSSHDKIHLNEGKLPKCQICEKSFMTIKGLKQHEISHQKEKPKIDFECKMCTYKTPRKGNLDRHLYSKHKVKINEGKVSVNIGFGIFEETYEKVVPKIEETEKPSNVFLCHCCVFLTSTLPNLEKHLERKHERNKEEKMYICNWCGYKADRPAMMKRHQNKVHKDVNNNPVIEKYIENKKKTKKFTENDVDNMVNECNGSVHEILRVVKILRKTFGRNVFVSNIRKIIRDKIKITEKFHESVKMAFKNNIGDEIETVLTKVKDLEGFIEYIIQKRGYDKD